MYGAKNALINFVGTILALKLRYLMPSDPLLFLQKSTVAHYYRIKSKLCTITLPCTPALQTQMTKFRFINSSFQTHFAASHEILKKQQTRAHSDQISLQVYKVRHTGIFTAHFSLTTFNIQIHMPPIFTVIKQQN